MKRSTIAALWVTLLLHVPLGIVMYSVASEPPTNANPTAGSADDSATGSEPTSALNPENARVSVSIAKSPDYPIIRGLNSALMHFHDRHESEFIGIQGKFGLQRFFDLTERPRLVHSIRGQFDNWFIFQSPSAIRIRSTDDLLDGLPQFLESKELLWPVSVTSNCNDNDISILQSHGPDARGLLLDLVDEPLTMTEWHLARFQLIGLVKHKEPVAYVSRGVPSMDRLNAVPTELLNSFEQKAIDRLRSHQSETVVVDVTSSQIRMVGALRASENCVACHHVETGHLLGALTYQLISPVMKRSLQASACSDPSSK